MIELRVRHADDQHRSVNSREPRRRKPCVEGVGVDVFLGLLDDEFPRVARKRIDERLDLGIRTKNPVWSWRLYRIGRFVLPEPAVAFLEVGTPEAVEWGLVVLGEIRQPSMRSFGSRSIEREELELNRAIKFRDCPVLRVERSEKILRLLPIFGTPGAVGLVDGLVAIVNQVYE